MSSYAREYTSKDRMSMRDKADKLTKGDPHEKVDASSWTPGEDMHTETPNGMQPVSRRQYKRGGKVEGEAVKRADRKPRASGGRLANELMNRDQKNANAERPGGKDHVGGYKRGGAAHKDAGGPLATPISSGMGGQGRFGFNYGNARSPIQALGGLKRGGKAEHGDEKEDRALVKRMVKKADLTGKKDGGGNWIAGATKNKGALHRELHVPEGEKIPAKKLEKAEHSKNPTERKRANLAETLKGLHHEDGGRAERKSGGRAKGKMNVNIIIAEKPTDAGVAIPAGGAPTPPPPPGAGPGVMPPPPRPAMAVGVPVGMPGAMGAGAPPMPAGGPPMGRKSGGRTVGMDAGAGSGEGRLEKARKYGRRANEGEG